MGKLNIKLYDITILVLILINISIYVNNKFYTDIINEIRCESNTLNSEVFNKPTKEQNILIDSVRSEIIKDIQISNKLTDKEKDMLINGLIKIPVYVDSLKTDSKTKTSYDGIYINNPCVKHGNSKFIIIDQSVFDRDYRYVLLHEFRHYIDNLLIYDDSVYNTWSDKYHIKRVLDQKILDDNYYSYYTLRSKIRSVAEYSLLANTYKDSIPELHNKYKEFLEDKVLFFMLKNKKYITSNSEIYVRVYIMKKWLIDNGAMKDINEPITEEHIKYILLRNPIDLGVNVSTDIQFFELFFYFDIDINMEKKEFRINNINDLNNIKF